MEGTSEIPNLSFLFPNHATTFQVDPVLLLQVSRHRRSTEPSVRPTWLHSHGNLPSNPSQTVPLSSSLSHPFYSGRSRDCTAASVNAKWWEFRLHSHEMSEDQWSFRLDFSVVAAVAPLRCFAILPLRTKLEAPPPKLSSACVINTAHCESDKQLSHAFSRPCCVSPRLGYKRNLWVFLPISVDHMKLQLGYVKQFQVSFLPAFNILHQNTLNLVEIFLSRKTLRDLIYADPCSVSPSPWVKTHHFQ